MNNLSGKDFLKTLKCLDIETGTVTSESLDWIFNKDTSNILTWLCTYVNENNIETCNEIQEYTFLKNEGLNLSEEYIENTCNSNPTYHEISNVNASQIVSLRRDVENAKTEANNLNKLTNKYLFLEGKLNRNIEEDELNIKIKRNSYLTDCVAYGKQIDELHNNFYENVEKLTNILSNYNLIREKHFISQIPLQTYQQQCDILQANLHLWKRKIFETSNFNYSNADIDSIDNEFNRLYFTLKGCIIKRVRSECNQKELTAKLSYFRNNSCTEMTDEHKRVQEIQLTSRINNLYDDLETLIANNLQEASDKFTNNLINTVLINNAEIKLNRMRDILKTLKSLSSEIIQALAHFELLVFLFKTDKIKLQNVDKFLEDLYFYCSSYLKNYSLKTKLMNEVENNVAKDDCMFKEIISILTEKYNHDSVNIRSAISEMEKQKLTVDNLENELFINRNQKYISQVKHINIMNCKKFIWCGPTLQPVIIPYEFLDNLNIANCQLEKVKTDLKTMVDKLNETRNKIKINTWTTYQRQLWIWFLMKPEKIPAIIEQLKDFVTEQAKANT